MILCMHIHPVELGRFEAGFTHRIGRSTAWLDRRVLQFLTARRSNGFSEVFAQIGEEQEGLLGAPLLTHEDQRNLGGEENDRCESPGGLSWNDMGYAIAEWPVAHLIVVLHERDECGRGKESAWLSLPDALVLHALALPREPFRQRPAEQIDA